MKQVDKKKIIDAAFHIFVRDKIESAKMSEIAQAAGVGRATLFRIGRKTTDCIHQ